MLNIPIDTGTPAVEDDPDPISVEHPRRRRRWPWAVVAALVAALWSGGAWWNRMVSADPGLSFDGFGANVFRNPEGGDKSGITEVRNSFGTDAEVAYEAGSRIHAFVAVVNRGPRTVKIEAIPPQGFYYWAFDGAALSENPNTAFAGRDYSPFRPFTLEAGETRHVRLDFHQADCNPAGLQDGDSRLLGLPVTYRTLGRARTVEVPFDRLRIGVSVMGECDRPLRDPDGR